MDIDVWEEKQNDWGGAEELRKVTSGDRKVSREGLVKDKFNQNTTSGE